MPHEITLPRKRLPTILLLALKRPHDLPLPSASRRRICVPEFEDVHLLRPMLVVLVRKNRVPIARFVVLLVVEVEIVSLVVFRVLGGRVGGRSAEPPFLVRGASGGRRRGGRGCVERAGEKFCSRGWGSGKVLMR